MWRGESFGVDALLLLVSLLQMRRLRFRLNGWVKVIQPVRRRISNPAIVIPKIVGFSQYDHIVWIVSTVHPRKHPMMSSYWAECPKIKYGIY